MKNSIFAAAALIIALSFTGGLMAETITLTEVDGEWTNPVGGEDVVITNGGDADAVDVVTWGVPYPSSSTDKSGYAFDAIPTINVGSPDDGTYSLTVDVGVPFLLGEFCHENWVLDDDTGITSVDLDIMISGFDAPINATFTFNHDETTNSDDPIASRDIVSITGDNGLKTAVMYGGNDYVFQLLGFSEDGGQTLSTDFYTFEEASNYAGLWAVVNPVPEPTSLLLLGSGIGALGLVAYRRKKK